MSPILMKCCSNHSAPLAADRQRPFQLAKEKPRMRVIWLNVNEGRILSQNFD